jgi:hypothetical protein
MTHSKAVRWLALSRLPQAAVSRLARKIAEALQ